MSICDVIVMLKLRHHVALPYSGFSGSLFHVFFSKENEVFSSEQENNPLFVRGWDRKIRPSSSPFIITAQAS